jgi:glycerol-3-phosphate dehydrogenase (NAD(P)+)
LVKINIEKRKEMRIGYLGAGSWGFALASLLAAKGHEVTLWTANAEFAKE